MSHELPSLLEEIQTPTNSSVEAVEQRIRSRSLREPRHPQTHRSEQSTVEPRHPQTPTNSTVRAIDQRIRSRSLEAV